MGWSNHQPPHRRLLAQHAAHTALKVSYSSPIRGFVQTFLIGDKWIAGTTTIPVRGHTITARAAPGARDSSACYTGYLLGADCAEATGTVAEARTISGPCGITIHAMR